ncbi:MAG TPA: hypothetical protein VMT03_22485 [Polyangia bacterium]|nr:hypothetical protein [Polyangia bacterium]
MQRTRRDDPKTWFDEEAPVGRSLRGLVARLVRRGRASWFVWAPLALLVSLIMTVRTARSALYEATVVLRVTESTVAMPGAELAAGTLRGYVKDRALTVEHLQEVLERYPRSFPRVRTDPATAVDDMREATDVLISQNDFVEDRGPGDGPRSARIAVDFRHRDPEVALTVARDLAELIVRSASGLDAAQLERERVAAVAALKSVEAQIDSVNTAESSEPGADEMARKRALIAQDRLRAAVVAATDTSLTDRASEEKEVLRFDVIDSGRVPPLKSRSYWAGRMLGVLAAGLLIACLIAGAFDPRILDRTDLSEAGLKVLCEAPPLPQGSLQGPRAGAGGRPGPRALQKSRV